MTFEEWADQHDLTSHERQLCWEYLVFIRTKAYAAWLLEWIKETGAGKDGE